MSTHAYQLPRPPTPEQLERIVAECDSAGRHPSLCQVDGNSVTLWFDPDLTAGEISALNDVMRAALTDLTRLERNAIQSDIDLLVTYQGVATPTLAQTAAAVKAQSRILRALLRS
jgi:hypothetical protein